MKREGTLSGFPVRRVIVGATGSPGSLRALRFAKDLARHTADAVLIPVLAWTPPGGDLAERRAPSSTLRRIWAEDASQRLRDALDAAWGGGERETADLTVRSLVGRGEPGPVLIEAACSADDLLVVGAGQRGPLARIRHGRVSRYCQTTPGARYSPSRPPPSPRKRPTACAPGRSGTGH